jgi:hypothetical protein
MTTLLSVVIPTHNRAGYAIHAIRSLLAIPDPRLEIVVSDTSTNDELANLIDGVSNPEFKDRRLKYFRPPERLDMTGNHNSVIAAASGSYICLIGDDDTVVHDALLAAEWANKNDIDIIAPNVVANYAWPDFRSRYFGARHAARIYFSKNMGDISTIDSKVALLNALSGAAQGTDGLPKIYHGLVNRSVLNRLRERSGAFFHGSSPDVSGAIGLALVSDKFVVTDYPLTIPGASGGSNTGRSAMNTHKGALNQESQTRRFEASGWSPGVPRFFSVETVWAHAALETLARVAPGMIPSFNFIRLIAICRVLHPEFDVEIKQSLSYLVDTAGVAAATLNRQVSAEAWRFIRLRWMHFLRRSLNPTAAGGRHHVDGLATINAAPDILATYMRDRGLRWADVAKKLPGLAANDHS